MPTVIYHLPVMQEFAQIIRGEHSDWNGDRRLNASVFLRAFRDKMVDQAEDLAHDIQCNLDDYSLETGLPQRTLEQATRILLGVWKEI